MDNENTLNRKKIAKNTIMLYTRMILYVLVTLYTSRVILQVLGVDDFGIYGIVGGVVAMFSFLNSTMSSATSRFITFYLGKGDKEEVRNIFSTAMLLHIGIAVLIVLLAETVGLWLMETKLVIPIDRMNSARVVYQLSIFTMAVQVIQVPYNASIISYERMDVYAYVELLNVFLKLGIVFLLDLINFDKLIIYSFLVFVVNLLIAAIYRLYCVTHFNTCHIKWIIRRDLLFPMISYSGWDLYGNACFTLKTQGISIVINNFFGVALNAASSIAGSVTAVVSNLASNIVQAFRPQIIKNYAKGAFGNVNELMSSAAKYTVLLFMMLCFPLSLEIKQIMGIWLGNVPDYASEFCVIMLWTCPFALVNNILTIAVHATGMIRKISFYIGSIHLLSVPIVYVVLKHIGQEPLYAYYVTLGIMPLAILVNILIVKRQMPQFIVRKYIYNVVYGFILSFIASIPAIPIWLYISPSFFRVVLVFFTYIITLMSLTFFLAIDESTRTIIIAYVKGKIKSLKNI